MLNVPVVEFTRDDIVRSGVCAMWVRAFDEAAL
jgi:phosphate starvation-inducible PhoH-like protein